MKLSFVTRFLSFLLIAGFLVTFDQVTFANPPEVNEETVIFPYDDEVLLGFFDANQEISVLQKEIQGKIVSTLEKHGLTSERFSQIGRAAQIGALDGGSFSAEEIESFNAVAPQITNIQREQQGMMQAKLSEKGLSMQLYQEIINEFRKNQDMQAHVRELARNRAVEQVREERRRQRELEESNNQEDPGSN